MNSRRKLKAILGMVSLLCKEAHNILENDKELLDNPSILVFFTDLKIMISKLRGLDKYSPYSRDELNKLIDERLGSDEKNN